MDLVLESIQFDALVCFRMPVSCYKLSLLKNDAEETFKILQVSDAIIIGESFVGPKSWKRGKECVGRESNPDLLLGRQQC